MPGKAFRQEQDLIFKNDPILSNDEKKVQLGNNNSKNIQKNPVIIHQSVTPAAAATTTTIPANNPYRYVIRENDIEIVKCEKFKNILAANPINLEELQKASWKGISKSFRPISWKLLSVIKIFYLCYFCLIFFNFKGLFTT